MGGIGVTVVLPGDIHTPSNIIELHMESLSVVIEDSEVSNFAIGRMLKLDLERQDGNSDDREVDQR